MPVERAARAVGGRVGELPEHGLAQPHLAAHDVVPGRRQTILEVGDEYTCARIECVDDGLELGRAEQLHATVLQVFRKLGDDPVGLAQLTRAGQEIGQLAGVDLRLAHTPRRQQLRERRSEAPGERRDEIERLGRDDGLCALWALATDLAARHIGSP